jgi:hypothetical protein
VSAGTAAQNARLDSQIHEAIKEPIGERLVHSRSLKLIVACTVACAAILFMSFGIIQAIRHSPALARPPLAAPGLPSCTSPEVAIRLNQLIRGTQLGASVKSIDGHKELNYDREANVRTGQCVVHTNNCDVEVTFLVEWLDRNARQFAVRLLK